MKGKTNNPHGRPATMTDARLKRSEKNLKSERKKAARKGPPKARVVKRRPLPRTQAQWDRLLKMLPDYDPYAQAGGYWFDRKAARAAIDFTEVRCHHAKGPKSREPFLLEDWQRGFKANLHGWKHSTCVGNLGCGGSIDQKKATCRSCGRPAMRRYRECLLYIGRKNGKTPLAATEVLDGLVRDKEFGAEIYGAAFEYKQASLVFFHARTMVAMDPEMAASLRVYAAAQGRSIQAGEETGWSTYNVVAAESLSAHGWNTHKAIVDELHTQKDASLMEAIETSVGARDQPQILCLTTADFEREGSVCNEKHEYALAVRDGVINDPAFLPVIFQAEKDDDWEDRKVWAKANPNLGVSVSREYLEREFAKAKASPVHENRFRRLHLNQRTAQDVRWIPLERWDACAGEPLDINDFKGRECWAGLDLASVRDVTAFVLAFREPDGRIPIIPIVWMPKRSAYERGKTDRVPYEDWIRRGLIRGTDSGATDYGAIRTGIVNLVKAHRLQLREIAADRLFQGEQLCQELREKDGLNVFEHGQGFVSMAGPTKRFDELLLDEKLWHGGHEILRVHANNVAVDLDPAGNLKPSRVASTGKIDLIVAAIMAVGRATHAIEKDKIFTKRGIRWA
jgi:phage terminase large subunit-like protein